MREPRRRSFLGRFVRRASVGLVPLVVVAVVINVAPPDDAALSAAGPDFSLGAIVSWVMSGLAGAVGWAAPRTPPHGPGEASGTAAGRAHGVAAAATRAGGGTGRKPGKGKGELPPAASMTRTIKTGRSGGKQVGFDHATSAAVPGKSTATSTYYTNADGSYSRVLSTGPVNYQDGSKGWSRIDTGVRKLTDGRWHEGANSLRVQFAGYADDSKLASIAVDANHSVGQRLIGAAHVAGSGTTSTVTYSRVFPGIDLKLQATTTGDKESMILKDANAASSWDFALDLHGLAAAIAVDRSIVLKNDAGRELLSIPPGYAWDSAPPGGDGAESHA